MNGVAFAEVGNPVILILVECMVGGGTWIGIFPSSILIS